VYAVVETSDNGTWNSGTVEVIVRLHFSSVATGDQARVQSRGSLQLSPLCGGLVTLLRHETANRDSFQWSVEVVVDIAVHAVEGSVVGVVMVRR